MKRHAILKSDERATLSRCDFCRVPIYTTADPKTHLCQDCRDALIESTLEDDLHRAAAAARLAKLNS